MVAYIVGKLTVPNWDWYRKYRDTTEPLVEKYGGTYLIKGGESEKLEGDAPMPNAFVLIGFPDLQSATNWYQCAEYAEMVEWRQLNGVQTELFLIEGV